MSISISNTFSNTFQTKVDLEDSFHFPGAFSQTPFPGAGGSNTGAGAWRFYATGIGRKISRNMMVLSGKNRGWGNVNYPITIKHNRRCSIFLLANMMLHKQKWGLNHNNRNPRAKWSKHGPKMGLRKGVANISSSTTINWGVVGSLSAR